MVAPNYELLERNISELREWKDALRDKIENKKTHTSNFERFSEHLAQSGIEFSSKRQNVSYKAENVNKSVRGKTLGQEYDKRRWKMTLEDKMKNKNNQDIQNMQME